MSDFHNNMEELKEAIGDKAADCENDKLIAVEVVKSFNRVLDSLLREHIPPGSKNAENPVIVVGVLQVLIRQSAYAAAYVDLLCGFEGEFKGSVSSRLDGYFDTARAKMLAEMGGKNLPE